MEDQNIYSTPDLNNPLVLAAKVSQFGEQQGPETDPGDTGGFAYGGRSTNNPNPYVAVDPEWVKQGIVKPGDSFPIWNPSNPDNVVWGIVRDKGPARWTGRGLDLAPNIMQQLGLKTDETAHFDMSQARPTTPQLDLTTPEGARAAVEYNMAQSQPFASTQSPSQGVQSTDTQDSSQKTYTQYPDGSIEIDGVRKFLNGIYQTRSGNTQTEYIPNPSSPSGYTIHTHQVKPQDEVVPPIPTGMSVQDALKQLSPEDQVSVKDLSTGKVPMYTQRGTMSPIYQKLRAYVDMVNPDLAPTDYLKRTQAYTQYYNQAQGQPGANISSFNQAMKHWGRLADWADQIPTESWKAGNTLNKIASGQFGGAAFAGYDTTAKILATEMARAFKKGEPTEADIKAQLDSLNSVQTPEALRSVLHEAVPGALSDALEVADSGFKRATGKNLPADDLVYPETRKILSGHGINMFAGRNTSNGELAPTDTTAPKTLSPKGTIIKYGDKSLEVGKPYTNTKTGVTKIFLGLDSNGKPVLQ